MLCSLYFMQGVPEITSNWISTPSQCCGSHLRLREQRKPVLRGPASPRQGSWVDFAGSVEGTVSPSLTLIKVLNGRNRTGSENAIAWQPGHSRQANLMRSLPRLWSTVPVSYYFQTVALSSLFLFLCMSYERPASPGKGWMRVLLWVPRVPYSPIIV